MPATRCHLERTGLSKIERLSPYEPNDIKLSGERSESAAARC